MVFGLLGKSGRKDAWRLYLSLELDEYVEFADEDVVSSESLRDEESQIGGTVVWLRRDSNSVRVQSASRESQVGFLDGEIAGRYLRHVAHRPAPVPWGVGAFVAGGCLTTGDFDTLCAACSAVPTSLIAPDVDPAIRG